jgi:hypothetical protein
MQRTLFRLSGLAFAFWTTGCCLCDAPYDYCGPTFMGGPGEECVTGARMNSAFNPMPGAWGGDVVQEAAEPQSVLQPQSDEPGDTAPQAMPPDMQSPMPMPTAPRAPVPTTTQGPRARSVSVER